MQHQNILEPTKKIQDCFIFSFLIDV